MREKSYALIFCNLITLSGIAVLSLSSHGIVCTRKTPTAEARAEITSKYIEYDRAVSVNDAGLLLQFYSNEATENYTEEIKNRPNARGNRYKRR